MHCSYNISSASEFHLPFLWLEGSPKPAPPAKQTSFSRWIGHTCAWICWKASCLFLLLSWIPCFSKAGTDNWTQVIHCWPSGTAKRQCTRAAFSEESDAFCLWEDRENGKACSFVSVTNKCVFKCSGRTTEKGKALEDKTQRDNSDTLFIHLEQI